MDVQARTQETADDCIARSLAPESGRCLRWDRCRDGVRVPRPLLQRPRQSLLAAASRGRVHPNPPRSGEDGTLTSLGIGITDLVKDMAQSHDRGLDFSKTSSVAQHLEAAGPRWVAFNGLTAGRAAARWLGQPKPESLGEQTWRLGESRVFVLPSSGGANATMQYDDRLRWWTELAEVVNAAP
jgi:double-stranded uracil-DNA glycosylase